MESRTRKRTRSGVRRGRGTVSLPDRMPTVAPATSALVCTKHRGDPITEFSLTKQRCMCLRCATAEHDNFTDFVPVTECVKDKRKEANDLLDQIAEFAKLARSFRSDRKKFVENLKTAEVQIKGTIKKVKHTMIRHIDILENKLINNMNKLIKSEKRSANDTLTEIRMLEGQLNSVREHLYDIMKRGNDVEVITTVVEEKKCFTRLQTDFDMPEERKASTTITFKQSPEITNFMDEIKELGEISLQSDSSELVSPDFKFMTAPSPYPVVRDIQANSKLSYYTNTASLSMSKTPALRSTPKELFYRERGAVAMRRPHASDPSYNLQAANTTGSDASLVLTEDHGAPCNLTGVVGLESGLIGVCDAKHKCLQLMNRRSEILDDIVFHYTPCDLTRISDNSFAISYTHKDFISFFKVTNHRFSHVKDVQIGGSGGSYSIAVCGNKIAVCRKGEIRIVSKDDGSLLQVVSISANNPDIIMSDGGTRIYMADSRARTVTCMSDLGKVIWESTRRNMEPKCLALDLNQLFVADFGGRVFIFSTYGDLIKEIMCGGQLQAISVDPTSGNLLLTQESREKIRSRTVKVLAI